MYHRHKLLDLNFKDAYYSHPIGALSLKFGRDNTLTASQWWFLVSSHSWLTLVSFPLYSSNGSVSII
jgi:hypothetical protein